MNSGKLLSGCINHPVWGMVEQEFISVGYRTTAIAIHRPKQLLKEKRIKTQIAVLLKRTSCNRSQ